MSVELIDHMGSDLTVVNAARVSYAKHHDTFDESDRGLIRFLARERHGTPFEHVVFQFRVVTPIFVAREWFRHRIGTFSEMSGRYVEFTAGDDYMPPAEDIRRQVGKKGEYRFESLPDEEAFTAELEIRHAFDVAWEQYEILLKMGVAKEVARIVLPLGTMTQFYWTVNFRSLTNFLSLRTAPSAMLEIRREADAVEKMIGPKVPECYEAWLAGGRQSL